ncbi:DUF721 domain-containing protein [Vibrio sp. SM6]|uniref:DUF721 domain-containing protein n=1 Tax=Vibrio agarilyticus TaxID=2726741 RepID=A0A7X8TP18_9VIBR|nr:DciA family protein [Vibrio agarilyticus]NLS12290.1 DUF721 domain-containing protein [Vibrio agarilyticus]
MRDHRPTDAETLLSARHLGQMQAHAKTILALNEALQTLLPTSMAIHCRAANVREGRLVVEVASAALRMKLEYERLSLLSQLRLKGFAHLVSLELKINPALYRGENGAATLTEHKPREPLSTVAADYLLSLTPVASEGIQKRLRNIAALAQRHSD